GDFDEERTLRRIQEAYGPIRPARTRPDRRPPPKPRQRAERRVTMPWPTPTEKVAIGWHAPPYASRDYAVLDMIDELMTGGRSARLRRRLVDDLELVSELRGGASGLRYGGLFELWLSMREGHAVSEAIAIVDEEIERLSRDAVTQSELEKVKNRAELFFLSE